MLRHKLEGKEGNNISISISPDLEEGEGSGAFHLRGKFALRNGPGRERGEHGQHRKMEMEIGITPTLWGGNELSASRSYRTSSQEKNIYLHVGNSGKLSCV